MITIAGVGVMCAVETLSIARVSRRAGLFSVDGLGILELECVYCLTQLSGGYIYIYIYIYLLHR